MKRSEIKRRPLADTVVDALEAEKSDYRELHADGVYLRVRSNGGKDWQLRYKKPDGKWAWLGLGGYGKGAHHLTGQQARQKAAELTQKARDDGTSLSIAKKAAEGIVDASDTLAGLVASWIETKRSKWTPDNFTRARGMLDRHVIPTMGQRAYRDIQPDEWFALFKRMEGLGILESLSKIRSYCKDAYTFAQIQGWIKYNPIEGQHKFLASGQSENYPHVSPEETPQLIRDIRSHGARPISIGLQLMMLLAVRPGELRQARWDDFDLDAGLWTIAADSKKERRDFLLPLPGQAVRLLLELRTYSTGVPWLFPGRDDPINTPASNMTFNQALNRMGYKDRQTPHGMRHLFSTAANEAGKEYRIVDSALAHKVMGTEGVYNKAQYLNQRRELMQWWADQIDVLAVSGLAKVQSA